MGLTSYSSSRAALLSDADFPHSILQHFKGGRIRLFQILFERYSKLAFTKSTDRSVAISGLEKRLARIFGTQGGYGIFKCFLQRSLIWHRVRDKKMTRIRYPAKRKVPSWSWMAYDGEISYMDIPFGEVEWNDNIYSSFPDEHHGKSPCHRKKTTIRLRAVVQEFAIDGAGNKEEFLVFDEQNITDIKALKCVIIGKQKLAVSSNKEKHYVLILTPRRSKEVWGPHERVGVGWIPERNIHGEGVLVDLV